jgi:hypothetical protein
LTPVDDRDEMTGTVGWWLRLQLGLGLAGALVWLAGAAVGSDFLSGLGAGLLIAALALRLGRRVAGRNEDEES